MEAQGWTEEEGANLTIMTNREFFDNIGALHTEGAINRLLKYVKAGGFLMVGIDPFKLAFKGLRFQNDSDTITIALDPIHYESNNRHFAFLMLDHHGHARGPMGIRHRDPVEDVMSSSTKGSAPDVVIGFYEDGKDKRTILARGRRVSEQSLKLLYNETTKTNTRIEGDEALDLTGRNAKIVRWLRSHGKPAKNIEIAKGTCIAPSNTQPILKSLVISGVLKSDDEGKTYELSK
jgi:hypothetical protein